MIDSFLHWYHFAPNAMAIMFFIYLTVVALVCWIVPILLARPEDRAAENEMRREFHAIARRRKKAQFVSNATLAARREDCSLRVSRGFLAAMRDASKSGDTNGMD